MPEGPSIIILKDAVKQFKGKKVIKVEGNSKLEIQRISSEKIIDFKSWGKHFLICFKNFTVRIHFMLFGSYRINEQRQSTPRLALIFDKGQLNFYACSIKFIDQKIDTIYDWTSDVMNDEWDPKAAKKKLKQNSERIIADALLDQNVFAGVGNIIKNEVLFRIKVHPKTRVGDLSSKKLTELIKEARQYSFDFLEWKKQYVLKKHWLVHTKKICPRDGSAIMKEYLGKTHRRTFFCNTCQVLYT